MVATAASWLQSCVQVLRKFGNAGLEGARFFRLPRPPLDHLQSTEVAEFPPRTSSNLLA